MSDAEREVRTGWSMYMWGVSLWVHPRVTGLLLLAPRACFKNIIKFWGSETITSLHPASDSARSGPPHSKLHQDFAAADADADATSLPWPSHKSEEAIAVRCPPRCSSPADTATSTPFLSFCFSLFVRCYRDGDVYGVVITSAFVVTVFLLLRLTINVWWRPQHRCKGWRVT